MISCDSLNRALKIISFTSGEIFASNLITCSHKNSRKMDNEKYHLNRTCNGRVHFDTLGHISPVTGDFCCLIPVYFLSFVN